MRRDGVPADERRGEKNETYQSRLCDLPAVSTAHDDAHQQRDRDRRPDCEDSPRAFRESVDDDEPQHRDEDDHDEQDAGGPCEGAERAEVVPGELRQ